MRRAIFPFALVLALVTGLVLSELRLVALAPLGTDGASAHAIATRPLSAGSTTRSTTSSSPATPPCSITSSQRTSSSTPPARA